MSIRSTWNRMLRRTSTISTTSTNSASESPVTPASTAPSSPGWGPSATFSWLVPSTKNSSSSPSSTTSVTAAAPQRPKTQPQDNGGKKKKKSSKKSNSQTYKKRLHPSERPLTKENLRHQEMFANFSFGEPGSSSRGCSTRQSFESGISPCGSRRASFVDA